MVMMVTDKEKENETVDAKRFNNHASAGIRTRTHQLEPPVELSAAPGFVPEVSDVAAGTATVC